MLASAAQTSNRVSGNPADQPPRKLTTWEDLRKRAFMHESDALMAALDDHMILVNASTDHRPPKDRRRFTVKDDVIRVLLAAKLVAFFREESYPNGAQVDAYTLTAKGRQWCELISEANRAKYHPTTPEQTERTTQINNIVQAYSVLPEDIQKAFATFTEILSLPGKHPWMDNKINPDWLREEPSVIKLVLSAYIATLPPTLQTTIHEAIAEQQETKKN